MLVVARASHGAPTGGLVSPIPRGTRDLAASSLAGRSVWDERGELVLQLELSGPGVGIARETADGVWQPVTGMMPLGGRA